MLPSLSPRGSLPPSLQVPAVPPRIHRHLFLRVTKTGLVIGPASHPTSGSLLVRWGREGTVSKLDDSTGGQGYAGDVGGEELEVRGLLGLVRLWSAAYLLVVIHPTDIGPLPNGQTPVFNLPAGSIQAIPLEQEDAIAALQRVGALVTTRAQRAAAGSDADSDSDDEGDDDWLRSGEVQTPAIEALRDAPEQDGHAESKERRGFFPWSPFASRALDEKGPSSTGSTTPADADARSANAAAISTGDSPLDLTAMKRVSLRWNPFAPKAKAPTVGNEHPPPTTAGASGYAQGPADPIALPNSPTPSSTAHISDNRLALERKVVESLCSLFSAGQFFFSYDTDITRSPVTPSGGHALATATSGLPLWRRVRREFWWNEWLSGDLTEIGAHSFVLPVMQGFIQTRRVQISPPDVSLPSGDIKDGEHLKNEEIEIAVVSRRSRDRAGLRYQRRGIDDDGHVANFVESEQIVKTRSATFSFLQIRGSIPLFWSQSPYSASSQLSLKPAPTLDRPSIAASAPALQHFEQLVQTYGPQTIISLSEVSGKEGSVSNGYRELVADLAKDDVQWREFDFHHECQGMHFENVSKLVDQMDKVFAAQGYGEALDGAIVQSQKGTFRTNCIDCLDRTNVVQSAFARHVLGLQLASVGLVLEPSSPKGLRTELEAVFNDVWANNGDAISRSYAGTSALKGDFTRTGKRDWHGMLNDGLNSVARMYSSAFSDFWSQAVIDFMLGHRSKSMFTSEYMAKMNTAEPSNLLRLSIIRVEAVETCTSRVLEDDETRVAGWTLFSPREMNTTGGAEFEEKILLLTEKAVYVCSFDYNLEKVVGFTRIPLGNIDSIQKGAYVLSPLQEAGQDAEENYGFKLFFRGSADDTRLTSYTLRNERQTATPGQTPTSSPAKTTSTRPGLPSSVSSGSLSGGLRPLMLNAAKPLEPVRDVISYFAFKGISRDPTLRRRGPSIKRDVASRGVGDDDGTDDDEARTCKEAIDNIVTRLKLQCSEAGSGWDVGDKRFVVDDDVRSLGEAKRETSWGSRIEYGIRRFLWA